MHYANLIDINAQNMIDEIIVNVYTADDDKKIQVKIFTTFA